MTHSNDNAPNQNLLIFGVAAVALTIVPPGILAVLPGSDPTHSIALVLAVLRYMPDIGSVGLAITIVGLAPWLLTLGGTSHNDGGRSNRVSGDERSAEALLPEEARKIVEHIHARLEMLGALPAPPIMTEESFTITEMRTRYLPSTIDAYLAVSPSIRSQYTPHVVSQLRVLDAAVRDVMEKAVPSSAAALDRNGRFLEQRFAVRTRDDRFPSARLGRAPD
jgi:hypothetical protein